MSHDLLNFILPGLAVIVLVPTAFFVITIIIYRGYKKNQTNPINEVTTRQILSEKLTQYPLLPMNFDQNLTFLGMYNYEYSQILARYKITVWLCNEKEEPACVFYADAQDSAPTRGEFIGVMDAYNLRISLSNDQVYWYFFNNSIVGYSYFRFNSIVSSVKQPEEKQIFTTDHKLRFMSNRISKGLFHILDAQNQVVVATVKLGKTIRRPAGTHQRPVYWEKSADSFIMFDKNYAISLEEKALVYMYFAKEKMFSY
ncbi:MAG: hypothetical protein ACOCXT_05260 [Candidatus Dojkabacteria bacterium]